MKRIGLASLLLISAMSAATAKGKLETGTCKHLPVEAGTYSYSSGKNDAGVVTLTSTDARVSAMTSGTVTEVNKVGDTYTIVVKSDNKIITYTNVKQAFVQANAGIQRSQVIGLSNTDGKTYTTGITIKNGTSETLNQAAVSAFITEHDY